LFFEKEGWGLPVLAFKEEGYGAAIACFLKKKTGGGHCLLF
jgi:hypothetical protein